MIKEEPKYFDDSEEEATKKPVKKKYQQKTTVFKCKLCDVVVSNSKKLTAHRKIHKAPDFKQYNYTYDEKDDIYVCNTCETESKTKEEMEKHLEMHEEKFSCKFCDTVMTQPYKFSLHVRSHTGGKYQCPHCEFNCVSPSSILVHINRIHLKKFTYACKHCGKGFTDVVMYKEHELQHTGEAKKFSCIVCNKSYGFSSYLHNHQVRYHRVNIEGKVLSNQCYICFKIFNRKGGLSIHMKKHETNEPVARKEYLCDLCGKGFRCSYKLKVHYRVHTGVKPYECKFCSKSFTKKDYLNMHVRIHNGEKPYRCEYCGKCFNQHAPLRIHVRSHTGERPYKCHLCDKGFVSKSSLTVHFKTCQGSK